MRVKPGAIMDRPTVAITAEMLDAAKQLSEKVRVHRTRESHVDALGGVIGEFAFSQWMTGDWRNHEVGSNKGRADFQDIVEVKSSVYPFQENLNLVIREDYGYKFKPLYVQVIINVASKVEKSILPGVNVILCGFASHEEATARGAQPMRKYGGGFTSYGVFMTPISNLRPMDGFRATFEAVVAGN